MKASTWDVEFNCSKADENGGLLHERTVDFEGFRMIATNRHRRPRTLVRSKLKSFYQKLFR